MQLPEFVKRKEQNNMNRKVSAARKRIASIIMAFMMTITLSFGIGDVSIVNVEAAEETKVLTNGNISVEIDKECNATQVSVDIKNAADGFHEFTNGPYVNNYKDFMYADNGLSAVINITDKDGKDVDYSGTMKVTYEVPDNWDLSHGVKAVSINTADFASLEFYSASPVDTDINGKKVSFTMDYNNGTDGNTTRFMLVQKLYSCDTNELADGVYDVNISMLSDVKYENLSMAANTVNRQAKLIISNGKKYLNVNFNMGVVMFMPAFANKVYSTDLTAKGNTSVPTYGSCIPGTINSFYGNKEAYDFSFTTMKNGIQGMGKKDDEIWELVNTQVLQNGIRAIHNVTLDVTKSLQDNGTFLIGFCSDIMDSLYDGDYGSDAGYNTTNIVVGNPIKTNENASDYVKTNTGADKSKLEAIFAEFINMSDPGSVLRNVYSEELYNQYYVPAWQKVYQAYAYADATTEQIEEAIKAAEEAKSKLVLIKVGEAGNSPVWNLNYILKKANKVDKELYTSASYNELVNLFPAAQAELDKGDEAYCKDIADMYYKIEIAYNSLVLKAQDYTALEKAINDVKDTTLDKYTEKTVKAFKDELQKAEDLLAAKDSSDEEVANQIKALYEAKDGLATYDILEDGVYKVNVSMLKTNRKDPSMAGGAINRIAKLEVVNGEYFLTIDFKGMTITNRFGYLSKLWYYDDGFTYNESGEPEGKLLDAEVLTTQKDSDGNDIIDIYNDADNLYPDLVKIKIGKTALSDTDGYVPLRVLVPIMETIAEGNGQHNVLMKVEWDSVVKTTEDDPDFKPTEPEEQSPALDVVDSATGIKVHADKGVFEKGVKLMVTPIESGDVYSKAENSLSEVGKKFKLYEIHFVNEAGQIVQPNGTVTVSYPIPDGYDSANVVLYRINEDGTKTLVKGVVEDGYYKVITKSFSTYALVEKGSTITDAENTKQVEETKKSQDTTTSQNNKSDNKSSVKTGDSAKYVICLMAMGLLAAASVIILKGKKKEA